MAQLPPLDEDTGALRFRGAFAGGPGEAQGGSAQHAQSGAPSAEVLATIGPP